MAQGQQGRGWDAPTPRTPFERTGGFLALGLVLVLGAVALGFLLGRGDSDPVSGGGSPPTSGPAGSAQDSLLSLLRKEVYGDCRPRELQAGQIAALQCAAVQPGANQLLVSQFEDTATMTADFQERYGSKYESGACGSFDGDESGAGRVSSWNDATDPLACYINDNDAAVVLWEYLEPAVQVVAVRDDGDYPAVWDFWAKTDKTLATD